MPPRRFLLALFALAALILAGRPTLAAPIDARTRATWTALRTHGAAIARSRGLAVTPQGAIDVFIRGRASRAALEAAGARVRTVLPGLCTAEIPAAALERVAAVRGVTAIRAAAPIETETSQSVPATGATLLRGAGPSFAGLSGQGVMVGAVDTGVDYGHGDFLDAAGHTRFVAIWDQTTPGTGDAEHPYGTMWTAAQLDAGLSNETDLDGHGTHVMGILGGDGSQTGGAVPAYSYAGMAPRADLAFVKTEFSTTSVVDAVLWLFERAADRGENSVVNLSLGTQYGPHDGTSDFERGLSELAGPGRIIVKSAGNDRGLARHAGANATAIGASVTLSVSGSAQSRSFAIDGYYDASEMIDVEVHTPSGGIVGPVALGNQSAMYPGSPTPNGDVYLSNDSLDTGRRNIYLEVTASSVTENMNGTWTFVFTAEKLGATNGAVDLWRFQSSTGVNANFVTGNQPTRELVTEPGNAEGVITVGAYVTRSSWTGCNGAIGTYADTPAAGNLSGYSSPGPTRDGRMKPDLVAPGEVVISTASLDVTPTCPASPAVSVYANDGMNHIALRGTSVAAPHMAGAVALLLQKRGNLEPAQVLDYFRTHARHDAFTGATAGNDWGSGKLDLGDLIDPTVSITAPAGGAIAHVGSALGVSWSAHDSLGSVANVDVAVSRTGPAGPFTTIATAIPNSGSFSWTVTGPQTAAGQAYLRVVAHDTNANAGTAQTSGFTITGATAAVGREPFAFALGDARPNPARGPVSVSYTVGADADVRLAVEDLQGRRVATLANGWRAAGRYDARWGALAPPGLYFLVYDTPAGRFTRRVALAR